MSKKTLFVTNFPDDATEADFQQHIFGQSGQIESVQIYTDDKRRLRYAIVEMLNEKGATNARNTLNGLELNGRFLSVTPYEPLRSKMSEKQRKVFEDIVQKLGETELEPMRQLEAIIMLCGTNFAEAILKETELLEANGGLVRADGENKRTKGGIFFYLVRFRISQPLRVIIYNRKGRLVEEEAIAKTS